MDKNGSTSSPHQGGMYLNLMMPGFTGAGAGTTYVTKAVIPRRTAATPMAADIPTLTAYSNGVDIIDNNHDNDNDNDSHDVDAHFEDNFSEAATELHDNLTTKNIMNSMAHRDRYYLLKSSIVPDNGTSGIGRDANANANITITNKNNNNIHNNDQTNYNLSDSIEVEANFGFFPSTKPPPSPSLRSIGGTLVAGENRVDSNEKFTKTPNSCTKNSIAPQSPSPRPISPPPVTRKQLVTVKRSSSTAAVVEDEINRMPEVATKTTSSPTTTTSSRDPRNVERENGNNGIDRSNYYQIGTTDPNPPQMAVKTDNKQLQEDEHDTAQDRADTQKIENQRPLHDRPFAIKREMKREVSTFSLAPETGAVVDREEHQAELMQWKEREASNQDLRHISDDTPKFQPQRIDEMEQSATESGNDRLPNYIKDTCIGNDEINNHDSNINRRLDLNALQEMDRMENQQKMKGLQSFENILYEEKLKKMKAKKDDEREDKLIDNHSSGNGRNDGGSEELSTSSSIVSSTCSEFGTVIQMGDTIMSARMQEVEEMELAALTEAPIEECDTGNLTKVSQLSSTSLLQYDTCLDLPILESSSSQEDTIATETCRLEAGLQPKEEIIEYQQFDVKTTAASANSTTNPRKRNPTKSEMLSAAFRRIGPIHSLNNNIGDKKINSLSAPTTPMRMPPPNYSKQSSDASAVGRESSPSRYETASDSAEDPKNRILSPRFASFLRGKGNRIATSSIAEVQTTTQPKVALHPLPLSPRVAITQTFQFAQKCFSYNNTLTEYSVDGYDYDIDFKNKCGVDERRLNSHDDLTIPPLGQRPIMSRLAPRVLPLESSISLRNSRGVGKSSRPLRYSYSLDSSSKRRSPFRELPSSTTQRYPFLHHSFPAPTNEATTRSSMTNTDPTLTNVNLRGRINSDFSPSKHSKKTFTLKSTMELKQPQRIEIEREDALDILACLVEQGIADWNTSTKMQNIDTSSSINPHNRDDTNTIEKSSDLDKKITSRAMLSSSASSPPLPSTDLMETTKEEKTEEGVAQISPASKREVDPNDTVNFDHCDSDSALQDLIEDLMKWVGDHDEDLSPNSDDEPNNRHQDQRRTDILQKLVRSHAYAVEMKRASASASTWLKSIGRGQSTTKHERLRNGEEMRENKSIRISTNTIGVQNSKNKESITTDKMERLTLKATLHSAQLELAKTKQFNSMLNEELSKCRAEIGRMKSVSRSVHLNKSILDDSERSSDTSFSEACSKESSSNAITRNSEEGQPKGNPKKDPKYEQFFQGVPPKEARERIESAGELDVIILKSALEKANETIRRLHGDLHKNKVVKDGEDINPAPVVDIPDIQVTKSQPRSATSTPDCTHRTVNVHMLNGENFITDWDDLRTLPPPPDHSLQSPIVSAILEQWTQDRSLHESLLSWMDSVMKGDNLEGLAPLTISSLDHQVRDGFTMHVLPHLLRRADIHVAVQTRTHRKTTYDMSVTVSQKKDFMTGSSKVLSPSTGYLHPKDIKSQQQLSLLDRRDSMSGDEWANRFEPRLSSAESVAHSAVTETISNLPATVQNQPGVVSDPWNQPPRTPVQTEYSDFSSQLRSRSGSADTFDESSQHYRQLQSEQTQGSANSGTIMGALGGALSGLLSRNKYAVSPGRFHPSQIRYRSTGSEEDSRDSSNMLPASLRAQMDLTSSPTPGSTRYHRVGQLEGTVSATIDDQHHHHQEEPQPYHRVVSAPPGRIGVTFVEYRGHAMVSDVAMDSPLSGWVFPSDILIAVDEIPVSGMRVRDIVTILSDRKNRQRAMRVISSHAMNEFTMMSQVGGPMNENNGEDE